MSETRQEAEAKRAATGRAWSLARLREMMGRTTGSGAAPKAPVVRTKTKAATAAKAAAATRADGGQRDARRRERKRRWQRANRDKAREYSGRWRAAHPDQVRDYERRRRNRAAAPVADPTRDSQEGLV